MDGDYVVAGLFFDLSKDFDTIAPNFIENKFYNLGSLVPIQTET